MVKPTALRNIQYQCHRIRHQKHYYVHAAVQRSGKWQKKANVGHKLSYQSGEDAASNCKINLSFETRRARDRTGAISNPLESIFLTESEDRAERTRDVPAALGVAGFTGDCDPYETYTLAQQIVRREHERLNLDNEGSDEQERTIEATTNVDRPESVRPASLFISLFLFVVLPLDSRFYRRNAYFLRNRMSSRSRSTTLLFQKSM